MTPPRVTPDTLAILKIPASAKLVGEVLFLITKHHPDCVMLPSSEHHPWLVIEQKPTQQHDHLHPR